METTYIEHKGIKYPVNEPTIETWKNVMVFKDIFDEEEMHIKMISEVTGLSMKEIENTNATEIRRVGDQLWRYLNQESKEVHKTIEHKGITYNLVDVTKISFGQFVDIDTFLKKDEVYKIANLNELAAYLYCEDGLEYGKSDFSKRIEEFKDLPVKYIEGSVFFLLSLARGLQELSQLYLKSKVMWMVMRVRAASGNFGAGMRRLLSSQKTKFGKLIILLTFPFWLVSIIFLFLLTLIVRKKNK